MGREYTNPNFTTMGNVKSKRTLDMGSTPKKDGVAIKEEKVVDEKATNGDVKKEEVKEEVVEEKKEDTEEEKKEEEKGEGDSKETEEGVEKEEKKKESKVTNLRKKMSFKKSFSFLKKK